ncbi:hypothetical protein [Ammoniphilus sp. 3BR4]|uniref:hypothetical protein n=1 Tax=Ammoniphilus sp. 3BR4 TaxID=3158265 RepID=UPI003467D160
MRKFYLFIGVFLMIGLLACANYLSALISQEGNPIPFATAIIKLDTTNSDMIKVTEQPDEITYIARTSSGNKPFTNFMKTKGYQFKEQLGSGYIFEKNGEKLIVSSRQYTGNYTIWRYRPASD